MKIADLHEMDFEILRAASVANDRARQRFVDKVLASVGANPKLAVWGLAFKAQTDDVRKSAAIDVIELLLAKGAVITAYDPLAVDNARRILGDRVSYAASANDAIQGVEALLILTEWPEFREIFIKKNPLSFSDGLKIFDGRNLLADLDLPNYVGVGLGR